jgi:hypothetical protein
MLCPSRETLWVRHQAEDQSTCVTDTGNATHAPIEVICLVVSNSDLTMSLKCIQEFIVRYQSTLTMGTGQEPGGIITFESLRPNAACFAWNLNAGPRIAESTGAVLSERYRRLCGGGWPWQTHGGSRQQASLYGYLEAIARADHRYTALYGCGERRIDAATHESAHDAPSSNVIAETEATRQANELVTINAAWIPHEIRKQNRFRHSACCSKRLRQFKVAVDSGSSDDKGLRSVDSHGVVLSHHWVRPTQSGALQET